VKLIIVSGLSGSGKSVALNTLEDLGYYCIDNLPASLLGALAPELNQPDVNFDKVAVGIDARNLPKSLEAFGSILDQLHTRGIETEIIFLASATDTLIKRFSESRRRHPLSNDGVSLADAIDNEKHVLEAMAQRSDLSIDTTKTTIHQLRDLIRQRVARHTDTQLSLLFESFGFKHGNPTDADFVFDARCLPNPHWKTELRPLTGRDAAVIKFLESDSHVIEFYQNLCAFFGKWISHFEADNRSYLTIAIGCTGGQHRSVYLAEKLAKHFSESYPDVAIRHRELP
jgi:RNase adapter protein RapZ